MLRKMSASEKIQGGGFEAGYVCRGSACPLCRLTTQMVEARRVDEERAPLQSGRVTDWGVHLK